MAVDNNVSIAGNLVADPELRYTKGGAAISSLRVAVNRRWQKDGEWEEETSFFDVTCWAQIAENCAESLTKGMRVVVTGRLEEQRWEDKESGIETGKTRKTRKTGKEGRLRQRYGVPYSVTGSGPLSGGGSGFRAPR